MCYLLDSVQSLQLLAINQKQLKIIRFMHNSKSTATTKTVARTRVKDFKRTHGRISLGNQKNKIISKKRAFFLPKQVSIVLMTISHETSNLSI